MWIYRRHRHNIDERWLQRAVSLPHEGEVYFIYYVGVGNLSKWWYDILKVFLWIFMFSPSFTIFHFSFQFNSLGKATVAKEPVAALYWYGQLEKLPWGCLWSSSFLFFWCGGGQGCYFYLKSLMWKIVLKIELFDFIGRNSLMHFQFQRSYNDVDVGTDSITSNFHANWNVMSRKFIITEHTLRHRDQLTFQHISCILVRRKFCNCMQEGKWSRNCIG